MPVLNPDIARAFDEIADLLEIEDANPFRVRAYRTAARLVLGLSSDLKTMVEAGEDLTELPGIGEDLAKKIIEIVTTGHCSFLEKLEKQTPPALTELLKVPGLGPRRVKALWHELDVETVDQLTRAAREGRIRNVPGFGEKTEARILEALQAQIAAVPRFPIAVAAPYAAALVRYLQNVPGVRRVVVAGSFRRGRDTVGDLDILATATADSPVMERFTAYEDVAEVFSQGTTRATVILRNKLQVDLRAVDESAYGAALHYFTGSKSHNIAIRRMGQDMGLKVNEYGLFRGKERIAGDTEESVYAAVGLPYIEPELRENRGEIQAARSGHLPKLVAMGDLRGDLHAHSKASDGHYSMRDMAAAARAAGLEYLAITEHCRHLTVAHGLDPVRLRRQMDEIDALNTELDGITLLKGIEVDILEDGSLDLPDGILSDLDLVVAAVHYRFDLSRGKQTARILKAMDSPHFTILAHPSGRLIGSREPMDVDMPRIIRHARERGCFLEINAQPERLDLVDIHARTAKEEGVLLAVNSDAHSIHDFDNLRFGLQQAQRGWLEMKDVLNTRTLKELRPLLAATMSR
ncbi:DNA polymerase/3'-5' exonuclease PolX [Acidithiobacillus ferrooxidans F221]|uniref:DNA polymerase/3'-5' exonuclease PolX n=1 Tax=Acidithiobacillus ferrooxidans TaxID=920 RepID=UPI001C066102|nr:DNA polymerase/3'-5' exonuclease PolX [Acidithiobacillus ferrooxidans]MBU2808241.1 DNA polymerase/3'-5' exonuclease PolX [Acidithiobacillus ferrooxidans F221]